MNGSSMAPSKIQGDARRDSGLAPSSSTARESRTTLATEAESALSSKDAPSLGKDAAGNPSAQSSLKRIRKWRGLRTRQAGSHVEDSRVNVPSFTGIKTTIPTGSIDDLTSPGNVQFSKRGSLLIGGKRANSDGTTTNHYGGTTVALRQPITIALTPTTATTPARVISVDDDLLSQRVRSFYNNGTDRIASDSHRGSGNSAIEEEGISAEVPSRTPSRSDDTRLTVATGPTQDRASSLTTFDSRTESLIKRQGHELAGGIEDWEDIQGGQVDRYGFIVPRSLSIPSSSNFVGSTSPELPRLQRVSTTLQLASEVPRRQRSKLGRKSSVSASTPSPTVPLPQRRFSKRERRPPSSQGSYQSSDLRPGTRMRLAANRFPHNRDRRWIYDAGDMLTLPPGLADVGEHEEDGRMAYQIRRREREREDKWMRMARQIKTNRDGGGMVFEFDTSSPKLISRTWKGIPDRWRATAWHAFLTASARKIPGSPSDDELKSNFIELLDQSSPDDVQIDIDVPRTINSHIMFRRRYRGGQRLLFRVLHCLSVYFPETGYVQGMAALAATILCYFDEEMAFVMLVRMWQLRGLARLYESGFEGLFDALDEFDKQWLAGSDVATKMVNQSRGLILHG